MWASGSDPGFITKTLMMALLSVQRDVELIEIEEFGDLSRRPSQHMVMEQMGFGRRRGRDQGRNRCSAAHHHPWAQRGRNRIRFIQYGFVAMDVEPDRGLQPTGWRVRVHGDAPFDVSMPFPVPPDELASVVPAFNANGLVNAIPYICAARPGVLTTEDLPHILPRGPHSTDAQGGQPRG